MKYDYDLVVIGGGAAGLVAATGAAGLGAKTAMIEKNKLGGDCTWYGCIPSKALLKSSQVFSLVKRLEDFGISARIKPEYDASRVMAHVKDIVNRVSSHHPPEVFEKRGIKVLFGAPAFINNRMLELNGRNISSKRFILCSGSRPLIPHIEGLEEINYLTNENIFELEILPRSLIVLGGGPIGVEISQALSRLGVEVSIVEMFDRLLFKEDEEIATLLQNKLVRDGIKIHTGRKAVKFSKEGNLIVITLEDKNRNISLLRAERVLVAVGRRPNTEGLGLENAGVKYTDKGVKADAYLTTTAANIYACGDVTGPYQFSHMAEYQAVIAVGNALFPFKRKVDYDTVPWCTFTDPELSHVGRTEKEARNVYKDIRVYRSNYGGSDRAVTDLEEEGLAKVICDKKGRIIGAHIVGVNAGELIHEYILAKSAGLNIGKISSAVHIYPTIAQVVKKSADQYYTDMLKSKWFLLFSKFMLRMLT